MHTHSLDRWTHRHVFLGRQHSRNERRTWLVVVITAAMMVAEIIGGFVFGSMALLADGWHMATHAAALGISGAAYRYARKQAQNPRFTFGTGKIGDLAAFASAFILIIVALQIAVESVTRVVHPLPIAYGEAITIAVVGLIVNLVSAWLLQDDHHGAEHSHERGHERGHEHEHHHHVDHNLKSAYLHVVADAATSVLAIGALLVAMLSSWVWMDPVVGIIGSVVIAVWAVGLIRKSGAVLLDVSQDPSTESRIRQKLEIDGDRITDLHLWQVGPGHRAAVISLVSDHPRSPSDYKQRLSNIPRLSHVTIEVEPCHVR